MTDFASVEISINILLAILVGTAFLVVFIGIAYQRLAQRKLQNVLEARLQQLEKQIQLQTNAAVGVGHRLIELEKRLQNVQNAQKDIRQGDLELSFIQAQKMIEQGMDASTVSASSGLSASEVALMEMMCHRQSRERA